MANLKVKDSENAVQEIKATGAGSAGDPLILSRSLSGPLGRGADGASVSVALSIEDVALIDGIEGSLVSILAKLLTAPATEAKQDTANTLLTTQAGYLDGLETLLTAIDGHVDGLEGVEGTTAGAAVITDANGTMQQYLRGLVTLWLSGLKAGTAIIGKVGIDQTTPGTTDSVTPKATEVHLGQVGGTTLLATGTMTRTADTNVYAAGDGVTTATSSASGMTVSGAARVATGSGIIFGGVAEKSTTSTTNASFRIWIYQAAPTAIPNDNAAFTAATHADYQKLIATATFDFATGIVGSDGVRVSITLERLNVAFKIASGSDLIVIWEARAAYTPGNAEVFRLALDIAQD